ncbi:unnamed protein product [Blepharisma stoltei]|uniref:Uncharacterized protein n=1 Tax=Blepharisma stoltei TaxID=1481888 RepID=A0AAU9IVS2_9CILI|nr:unnamed protein product [Blepharisma stoltei]
MSDTYQLNLYKQMHTMLSSPPKPRDNNQPYRNPLVPDTLDQAPAYKSRSSVPGYMESSKPLTERPRGIARTSLSDKHSGSFAFSYETPEDFVPSRRVIAQKSSETFEQPISVRKSAYQPPERNPITQNSKELEVHQPKVRGKGQPPSSLGEVITQDKKPVEETPARNSMYFQKMRSNIFDGNAAEVERERPKKKVVMDRPEGAGSLLQYNYALEYRDSGVSGKPSDHKVEKEALQQTKVSRGMAEVFKMRRNQSAVTFA